MENFKGIDFEYHFDLMARRADILEKALLTAKDAIERSGTLCMVDEPSNPCYCVGCRNVRAIIIIDDAIGAPYFPGKKG